MRRRVLAALAALALAWTGAAQAACAPDVVELKGPRGVARFSVQVADTDATRSRGLMFVERMRSSAGMLFVYDRPGRAVFWMKNTLIPLDMIFADATGTVQRVHENAIPHDETPIDGGDGVLGVLEINGGLARRLGIGPGTVMRHPAFAQGPAAWPCE
ncbi:MAG: DUF192 domain-containing protein [Gemmobacter sp.]|uniref:DUF192 domain-containing protein n=1 Tax=Gemmobacter sp. TaxID=1898957 RepID=UPI00391C4BE8